MVFAQCPFRVKRNNRWTMVHFHELGRYLKLQARGNAMNRETRGAVLVFAIVILACVTILAVHLQ